MKTRKTNSKKQAKDQNTMDYDQQIRQFEEKIARMEESRRLAGYHTGQGDRSLDETYEQFVLLKIRKMMGF